MRPPREAHSQDRTRYWLLPAGYRLLHYPRTVHPSDSSCIASPRERLWRHWEKCSQTKGSPQASLFHSTKKGESAMAPRADRRLLLATGYATGCRHVVKFVNRATKLKTGHLQLVPLPKTTTSAQSDDFRREGQPLGEGPLAEREEGLTESITQRGLTPPEVFDSTCDEGGRTPLFPENDSQKHRGSTPALELLVELAG